jgi:hypothetical protein
MCFVPRLILLPAGQQRERNFERGENAQAALRAFRRDTAISPQPIRINQVAFGSRAAV